MSTAIPKPPLPDAPPLPASPFGEAPAAPLPPVTAGRSGLPPFFARMKQKRQRAPLAPIASRAAARGERQRERVAEAQAVQKATQKPPSNVTPIRPDVQPEATPKPQSKAQEMRDALGEAFGKRVSTRMQGTPAKAHDLLRQYGAIHGRHFVGEYHAAGMARARELVEQARAAHARGTPANPRVKQAAAQAQAAQQEHIPEGTINRADIRNVFQSSHAQVEQARQQGRKFINPLDETGGDQ